MHTMLLQARSCGTAETPSLPLCIAADWRRAAGVSMWEATTEPNMRSASPWNISRVKNRRDTKTQRETGGQYNIQAVVPSVGDEQEWPCHEQLLEPHTD